MATDDNSSFEWVLHRFIHLPLRLPMLRAFSVADGSGPPDPFTYQGPGEGEATPPRLWVEGFDPLSVGAQQGDWRINANLRVCLACNDVLTVKHTRTHLIGICDACQPMRFYLLAQV